MTPYFEWFYLQIETFMSTNGNEMVTIDCTNEENVVVTLLRLLARNSLLDISRINFVVR